MFVLTITTYSQHLHLGTLLPRMVNHLQAILRERASYEGVERPRESDPDEVCSFYFLIYIHFKYREQYSTASVVE